MFKHSLTIRNFRSIAKPLTLPFQRKSTLLVGQNNIGKSNVLRLLAILFNNASDRIDETYDFGQEDIKVYLSATITKCDFLDLLKDYNSARSLAIRKDFESINLGYFLSKKGLSTDPSSHSSISSVIPDNYFHTDFLNDFGQRNSDYRANIAIMAQRISVLRALEGTTYLPNIRFITQENQEPAHFSATPFPGHTVAFGEVIRTLSIMDRPEYEHISKQKELMEALCDFMAFCLDCRSVTLQIPTGRKTILININGQVRPISSLGTGVEQILMIGLASIGFPGKLVLIDEPELHLHPRAQRQVMRYLNENVDAQFVMATHSAAILDSVEADIIQIYTEDGESSSKTVSSNRKRYLAIRDLGHSPSDLVQTRFAIWVEGPSDRIYLNHWISRTDNGLNEGIDYTILYYGGRVLAQHSFEDVEKDLVKAVTLCRAFAVIMDSDRRPGKLDINATKNRIRDEVEREGGFCWITEGREIENYLPVAVIEQLATDVRGVNIPTDKLDQILDPSTVSKVDFARKAISIPNEEWPMDLAARVAALVSQIRAAR
ncbi:MAG: AAA family ATPase [Rhizobiaceae bacterium]|nr:AAA family ATPase [Rhizobiaceae bacterium]